MSIPEVPARRGGHASPELGTRGQRTMRKLLDAAMKVFARRGFHAARVDDITRVARTSRATFYQYFANKEEVFQALAQGIAGELRELAEDLGPITADAAGFTELRTWLGRFAEFYAEYGTVIRAWTEAETGRSDFGRLGHEVLAEFSAALAERFRATAAPDLDADLAAAVLVAMVERFNYYTTSRGVEPAPASALDTLATVIHRSLFTAQPATTPPPGGRRARLDS